MSVPVYFETLKVGEITPADGQLWFAYDPSWLKRRSAFPISLSMPLREQRYGADHTTPWLSNLLPESHLHEIGRRLGVSPADVLGFLIEMGRDTAGALSIGSPRQPKDEYKTVDGDDALRRIIQELPNKPFLLGEDGVSMSLAGVQEKLPVALVDGKIAIPVNGTPSTHILKPDAERLKGSVQVEAYCLTLARLIGLDAAEVTTGKAGDRSYLLVKRYDRVEHEGRVFRVHQEDFCQLLGYFPVAKYEVAHGGGLPGPGLKDMFDGVNRSISPGARLPLLDAVIFNVLACNTDSHAKNYSLLIGQGGSAKIAPLYDVLCARVFPNITPRMAQRIGAKDNADAVHAKDWREMAEEAGLAPASTLRRVDALCDLVISKAGEARDVVAAMPAGGNQILDRTVHEVVKRATRIKRQIGLSPTPGVAQEDPEPALAP